MPPEITRLTKQFLRDPIRIEAARPATTNENITQHLVRIPVSESKGKRMALRELIGADDVKNGIIFCNRKSEVGIVAKSLKVHGLDAAPIHGDLDQSMRTKTLADFRSGVLRLLVASDVAARGLDIPDVSHVFNFDLPQDAADYVHRIGRTARAGAEGDAISFGCEEYAVSLPEIEDYIGHKIPVQSIVPEELAKVTAAAHAPRYGHGPGRPRGRPGGGNRGGGGGGRRRGRGDRPRSGGLRGG